MSFITGTQCELLYSMPGSGPAVSGTVTTGTAALLNGSGATQPAYFLPAYFFPDTYGVGKSLLIQGGGSFVTQSTTHTMQIALYADTAIGTPSTLVAGTGAFSPTASVTGNFFFEVLVTCTAVGTSATLNAVGRLYWGTGSNTAATAAAVYMIGAPQAAVSVSNATGYFIEPYASWGATSASQTLTLTNFTVWGLN
jgi:hypothetical protein